MRVLVLGGSGQVGSYLRTLLPEAILLSRNDCDLASPASLKSQIFAASPDVIVNAAAFSAVDKAEDEALTAWRVNAHAPAVISSVANQANSVLIHFSTDYVFGGQVDRPLRASDPTCPINVYGRTKLAGELAVRSICERYWIIRTSWVFSEFGSNFVKTMVNLANQRASLAVVDDQKGRPTFAGDLAHVVVDLLDHLSHTPALPWGTYHLSGGHAVSRFEFASNILTRALEVGLVARLPAISAIPTSAYPTRARRPLSAVLAPCAALERAVEHTPDWEAGLEQTLERL